MIYFFHHYELPAILQQIRIQEIFLQNQQAGQGNQTTLQDNLNNNTSSAAPANRAGSGGPGAGGGATTNGQAGPPQAPAPPQPHPNGLGGVSGDGGETPGDLDWVAETAAIITEALSAPQLSGALLDAESLRPARAPEPGVSVVAELRVGGVAAPAEGGGGGGGGATAGGTVAESGGGGPALPGLVTVEIRARGCPQEAGPSQGAGSEAESVSTATPTPSSSAGFVAAPPHTDSMGPDGARSLDTDRDTKTEGEEDSRTSPPVPDPQPSPS